MLARMIRWAREGSIATLTVVTLASAPAAAHAGWFDDIKDAGRALGAVFNPSHDIGKFALGSVMVGGGMAVATLADVAVMAGAAAIVGTAITGGAILIVGVGVGLAVWGGYKLWKASRGSDGPDPITPARPGAPGAPGTDPGSPGRIEPGRTEPGSNTPGTIGDAGNASTPGTNTTRPERTRPIDDLIRRPGTTGSPASRPGVAVPAGRPR